MKIKDHSPFVEQVLSNDVMKQLMKSLIKNSLVKEEGDVEIELKSKNKGKKKKKVLTPDEIRHQDYLSKLPIRHAGPHLLHYIMPSMTQKRLIWRSF